MANEANESPPVAPEETGAAAPALAKQARKRKRKLPWRAWLRAVHRDIGYLAVGLTFVYAVSGLAINHIDQWDPNFVNEERTVELAEALPAEPDAAAAQVLAETGIDEAPREAYFITPDQLEIEVGQRLVHVDVKAKTAFIEGQKPRFFLRVANWLHYNRGKKAWTYVADGYAVFLLFLAVSGMFMLKGRKGILGRGAVLVLAGVAVPVLYVQLSGGP